MTETLKQSDIKGLREKLLLETESCPLCGRSFKKVEPVLDHDHVSGMVRGILCRFCNGQEGRITNAAIRSTNKTEYLKFLTNLVDYLTHYRDEPSGLLHPSHGKPKKRRKRVYKKRISK